MQGDSVIQIGCVGVGGWGKNLARNYYQIPNARLKYLCDLNEQRRAAMLAQCPGAEGVADIDTLLRDPDLDAVIVATTAPSHFELAKRVLEADKDVFVEKPLVLSTDDAQELIELAAARQRILMVGHLLEYHPVVRYLKELIDSGELGDILYIYCQRLNLGTVRGDENALWNFAPHDVSVVLYLLGLEPSDVSARGQCYLQPGIEDVVFMTMNFGDKAMAHVHVSWLDPHKSRKVTVVGTKKMAVFDDLEANEKLRIYDKGAMLKSDYDTYAEYIGLRFGDITVPYIKVGEPLRLECEHFLECVRERRTPVSDGHDGLRVIRVLDAAQKSLEANGNPVELE